MKKIANTDLSLSESVFKINNKYVFRPLVYDMSKEEGIEDLKQFIDSGNEQINVHNSIESQILELYKINHPQSKFNQNELSDYWQQWQERHNADFYGCWVYYPWNGNLVHILPPEDFIRLRTSRNQYKIHPEEQEKLRDKTIGLIGLSVGQSVALTLSMERVYGTLRIADFDHLELSNLNRIRSGLANLNLPKTTVVAREIAEIDPFLKVEVFEDGITDDNLDSFIGEGDQRLDLLIEECDSLDIKIKARLKARAAGVPVIMDTSDRGMMDIERFDLEPERPLMHGMVAEDRAESVDQWTAKERLALVMDMVGAENISARLKASLLEVDESLTTWPQLASSVVLGGGLSTIVSRKILLGEAVESGRFYLDADELYLKKTSSPKTDNKRPSELSFEQCVDILDNSGLKALKSSLALDEQVIEDLVEKACLAPTGGNTQPWKWIWKDNMLALFHDQHYSYSFLDYRHRGSYIGLGAALENLEQRALYLGFQAEAIYRFKEFGDQLIAVYTFKEATNHKEPLQNYGDKLHLRLTNRYPAKEYKPIDTKIVSEIDKALAGSAYKMQWLLEEDKIEALAQIVGKVERQRILDPWGQRDFIDEARWTKEEAERTRNGVDLRTLELSEADKVGFKLIQDAQAIASLRSWDKGQALVKMSTDSIENSSALALLYTDEHAAPAVLEGGKWMERIWVYLNNSGLSYQPVSPATFMFARLAGEDPSTSDYLRTQLETLRSEYLNLLGLDSKVNDLFLCRVFYAREPEVYSLRKPLSAVYKNLIKSRA